MISVSDCRKIFSAGTRLEKYLLVGVASLTCVSIALLVVLLLQTSNNANSSPQRLVCKSVSCQRLGDTILASLDTSVNPCDNFYDYCCGGFLRRHTIPSDYGQYGVTEILRAQVLERHLAFLSLVNGTDLSNEAVKSAKKFYDSCMDLAEVERSSVAYLIKLLDELGGWPLLDKNWNVSGFDSVSAIAKIQLRTSYGFGIQVVIGVDTEDTSRNIIQLDSPSLTLGQSVLLNQEKSETELLNYQEFFVRILRLLGVTEDKDKLEKHFRDVIDFETVLAKAMTSADKRSAPIRMKVAELQQRIPKIDWLKFLQDITNTSLLSLDTKSVISEQEDIYVLDLPYLEAASEILSDKSLFTQIANYLAWRVVTSKMVHLPQRFQDALVDYSKASGFVQDMPPRWKTCVLATASYFADALSYLYVQNYFTEETRNEITKLVLDLRYQFESTISNLEWMDPSTKTAARSKLRLMRNNIGYPDWIADGNELLQKYRKMGMPKMVDDVFENDVAIIFHSTKRAILRLREKNEKQVWPMSPITVNAGYNRNINGITFPAAFLQEPMFSPSVPKFYNYATIGAIIGHEITHGFDNEGRRRNETGEMWNWWTNQSEAAFLNKTKCFVNQYNSYGLHGKRTLAENIADNGGLRQAYMEFVRWKKKQVDVFGLPGLDGFSVDQQFFLSYGSIWCTKYRPEYLNSSIAYADHSPAPYRVIGSLANLEGFSDAFKCPNRPTSPKCKIW